MAAVFGAASKQKHAGLPIKEINTLVGHGSAVRCVKFSTDGSYCLSGGYDKTIKLWNPYKGTRIREYLGHGYQVLGIAVSHDNSQIGSCGGDKQPILWDVSTGTVIKRFQGHDSQVNSIAFNEESTVMVTGGNDQMAKCWDAKSKHYAPIQTLDDAKDSVSCVLIRGHEIMTGFRINRFLDPVTSLCLSNDGNVFLVGSLDSTLRLIDKDDGSLYREYKGHKNTDFQVDSLFSYDDAYVISGSEDGNILMWSLEDGELVHTIQAHGKIVAGLCYHPEKHIMVSCSGDKLVKLWGPPEGS